MQMQKTTLEQVQQIIKENPYGEITLIIKAGKVVRIDVRKSILTEESK